MFGPSKKHLHDKKMTYLGHMKYSTCIAARLVKAAFCLVVHAVHPGLFMYVASNIVEDVNAELWSKMD